MSDPDPAYTEPGLAPEESPDEMPDELPEPTPDADREVIDTPVGAPLEDNPGANPE